MNWEYLHLISHSFPIVLSATGAAVGIAGWLAGREALEKWALVAFLVGGAFVVPAYVTGLAAADVVADRTFVRPSVIQRHRTWATFAAVPLVVAAILAGFSFAEPGDRRLRRFVILVGAAAAGVTGFAASLGARIEHGPETEDTTAAESLAARAAREDVPLDRRTGSDASYAAPLFRSHPHDSPSRSRALDPAAGADAGRDRLSPRPAPPGGRGV